MISIIKKIVLLIFLCNTIFFSSKSFSQEHKKDSLAFLKFKEIKNVKKKYFFYRDSIKTKSNIMPYEDWIIYLENDLKKHKNSPPEDLIHLYFPLVGLYGLANKIDKAINLGLKVYYNSAHIEDKDILCHLLILVENNLNYTDNSFLIIKVNKEKIKNCNPDQILFYNYYSQFGLHIKALNSYKKYILYNTDEYIKYTSYERAKHNNNFGVYHMRNNDIDSALYYYEKSLILINLHKKMGTPKSNVTEVYFWENLVKGNIAECYVKKQDYKNAIPLLIDEIEACKIYKKTNNWDGAEKSWALLALSYIKTKQFKSAEFYIKKLKKSKNLSYKLNYLKIKGKYYDALGVKDSSIFFLKKHINLSDSLSIEKDIKEKKSLLEYLDFEDDIVNQQKLILEYEKESSEKNTRLKSILFFSLFLFISILVIFYFYVEKRKQQEIILTQKNKLKSTLSKNQILLKELNHRVKNNLQMISSVLSLQSKKINDLDSKKYFNNSIQRIFFLSKIHNSLYPNNAEEINDFKTYINDLKNHLTSLLDSSRLNLKITTDIDIIELCPDQKITLGLIINELITNSFKHAFNDNPLSKNNFISIEIKEKEQFINFSYKDNGKGFNLISVNTSNSMGLNLILRLVNQLGTEANFSNTTGTNLNFSFSSNK